MAVSEIDTFYLKFKNLCVAGINATLTLHSEEGRAQVTLNADLGQSSNPMAEMALLESDAVQDVLRQGRVQTL